MSPQRSLGLVLGTTLAATTTIQIGNWLVDPFALRNAGAETGLPAERRVDVREPFWHKVLAVAHVKPAAVILGTSRADAVDAAHPGFAEGTRPVYNLSLSGVSMDQMRSLLVHAHHTRPLKLAIIGLDLESFLLDGRTDFDPAVLAGNKDSAPEWMNLMRLNLSWRALGASVALLVPEQSASTSPQEPVGRRHMFRVAEFVNFHSRIPRLYPHWSPSHQWDTDPRRAAAMRAFRDLISLARREGIELRLFISPVHARYLEMYRRVGWWPAFEAWKRALVATLEEEARKPPGSTPFPLWDFSGFNSVTTEAIPRSGDTTTPMRWYLESSHYTREHANLILDRILDRPRSPDQDPGDIGVLISSNNIEAHLRRTWLDADNYRVTHSAEIAEVARIVEFIRRVARK